MGTAVAAERATVELRIAGVGLSERLPHRGDAAAFQMFVGAPYRPHEALAALLLGQHDIALLLAVWFQSAMLGIDLRAVRECATRLRLAVVALLRSYNICVPACGAFPHSMIL